MSDYIYLLDDSNSFPPAQLAQQDPNGLLAIGGDLSSARLIEAYRNGIFPWYSEDEPILWWSPDPRCVFELDNIHISKSLARELKRKKHQVTINKNFRQVVTMCAAPRATQHETWILPEMLEAYTNLHQQGIAHSVEVWLDHELVGGLYGLSMGKFFFGESMFSIKPNASKIAFVYLAAYLREHDFIMIDGQVGNPHLYRLGAQDIRRDDFLELLTEHINWPQPTNLWHSKIISKW